jgi:hypothetical protein
MKMIKWQMRIGMVLAGFGVALGGCASAPEYCEDTSTKGFRKWANEEWVTYCEQLSARLEDPTSYTLNDLTNFYARHPERSGELRQRLSMYKDADQCYQGSTRLRYNAQVECLQTDDSMAQRVQISWRTQAEPWLEELVYRAKKTSQAIDQLDAARAKVEKEIKEKSERQLTADAGLYESYVTALTAIEKDMAFVHSNVEMYEQFRSVSSGYSVLSQLVNDEMRSELEPLLKKHKQNVEKVAELQLHRSYYEYALPSIGKLCPPNPLPRASREQKQAGQTLADELAQIQAPARLVRISEATSSYLSEETGATFETFEGFVCGARQPERQFRDRPVQCAVYKFTLERAKARERTAWEPWVAKSFDEAGPEGGVDCSMIK